MVEYEDKEPQLTGYHDVIIPDGQYGEYSKIEEEFLEFRNAREQGVKIMELIELSDLYGAIEGYLEKYHPSVTMDDISKMSAVTKRVFINGKR